MPIPALLAKPAISARRPRPFSLLLLFGASALCAFVPSAARSGESQTLIIPPADGYGFDECLESESPCGLVVADAWCKAHGFAGSEGFGPADTESKAADAAPGSFNVTCAGRVD